MRTLPERSSLLTSPTCRWRGDRRRLRVSEHINPYRPEYRTHRCRRWHGRVWSCRCDLRSCRSRFIGLVGSFSAIRWRPDLCAIRASPTNCVAATFCAALERPSTRIVDIISFPSRVFPTSSRHSQFHRSGRCVSSESHSPIVRAASPRSIHACVGPTTCCGKPRTILRSYRTSCTRSPNRIGIS